MFTYKYNLRDLGYSEDQYDSIASKAQRLARDASAVDTGAFKKGWVTSVQGDILLVQNAVRYAPFVELGSIVYRFHRFRIKRALASLGLERGTESFGNGTSQGFSSGEGNAPPALAGQGQTPSQEPVLPTIPIIQPITEQEIRSPALIAQRFKIPRASVPSVSTAQLIPKAQLFNRSRLLELLVAAEIVNQNTNNNEE